MSVMLDITGTIKNYFSLNNKATLLQGEEAPKLSQGKLGDIYFQTSNGYLWIKRNHKNKVAWDYYRIYDFNDSFIESKDESTNSNTISMDFATNEEIGTQFGSEDEIHAINVRGLHYAIKEALSSALIYRGTFDASAGNFNALHVPSKKGDFYIVSVAGVINGEIFQIGDMLIINTDRQTGYVIRSEFDHIESADDADLVRWVDNTLKNNGSALTINVDNNNLTNVEVDNFKSGVIQQTVRDISTATNTTLGTEYAVRNAIDTRVPVPTTATTDKFLVSTGSGTEWRGIVLDIPLFSYKYFDHEIDDIKWVKSDGNYKDGSIYTIAWNFLETAYGTVGSELTETIEGITIKYYLASNGMKFCLPSEKTNLETLYETVGQAWYYIIDTTNTKFIVPRTRLYIKGTETSTEVGSYSKESAGGVYVEGEYGLTSDTSYNKMYLYFYVGSTIRNTTITDVQLQTLTNGLNSKADINSPTLTGTPLAPTAAVGTNNQQIATTKFVQDTLTNKNLTLVSGTYISLDTTTTPGSTIINCTGGSGGSLATLSDVTLTSPSNNQQLTYDSATSKWINKDAAHNVAIQYQDSTTGTLETIKYMSQSDFEALGSLDSNVMYSVTGSDAGFPSDTYMDLTLQATGSNYTAPGNGYIFFGDQPSSAGQDIMLYIPSTELGMRQESVAGQKYLRVYIPVKKDCVYQVHYSTPGTTNTKLRFIYAEGEI